MKSSRKESEFCLHVESGSRKATIVMNRQRLLSIRKVMRPAVSSRLAVAALLEKMTPET
jgi:hypothetical protein